MQFMPMPLEYWQTRFNETNWPLCGTFRSYLFFRIHSLISDYALLRKDRDESLLMRGHFEGFFHSLEIIEATIPIRERAMNMFQELEGKYEEHVPIDYPGLKRSIMSLLDQMDEAESRVDWVREQVHQHFLVILDANDPTADSDLELRAEFNESADILRTMLWDLKLARDAVLWEGSELARKKYFATAREVLVENGAYEEFRRQYTPHEDSGIFAKLRASVDELELTLEVHDLWTEHAT